MRLISLILIFTVFHINAFTQKKISFPFSAYYNEDAIITFGIQYNYVYQNYQLGLKENWQQDYPIDYPADHTLYLGKLKSIRSQPGTGFSVGIPIDFRFHQNLYFSATPTFLFVNNLGIAYTSMDNTLAPLVRKSQHISTTTLGSNFNAFELPLNIKLRSAEKTGKNNFNRYRVYWTTGIRYSRWIGINKLYNEYALGIPTDPLVLKKDYFSWETGVGVDILFDNFKISPLIKFNQSFNNVLNNKITLNTDNKFMNPIEKAFIRNIYVGLLFQ